MKTKTSLLLLTLATALGISSSVAAKKAADALEVNCSYSRGMAVCVVSNGAATATVSQASASNESAEGYKWEITAKYDVDGVADRKKKFHFETSAPRWSGSPSVMTARFNSDEDLGSPVTKTPTSADIRVKALYMDKDQDKGKGYAKGGKGKSSPYSATTAVTFKDDGCTIGMCR